MLRHQKIHLIHQYAAVAQDEIFPQAGNVRRIEQRHMRLLGRAIALAVVATAAGGDDVHPAVEAALRQGNDVLTSQIFFDPAITAVSADIESRDAFVLLRCPYLLRHSLLFGNLAQARCRHL